MGVGKTSVSSEICTCSHSSCVCCMMRFKGLNGKVCKMMSHVGTLFLYVLLLIAALELIEDFTQSLKVYKI